MIREEYIKRLNEINVRFHKLAREKNDLKLQYIRESELNKFKYGEKVIVHKGKETLYAFVMGCEIEHDGEIRLILKKVKKDGTPAKNLRVFYFPEYGDTVEKINNNNELNRNN